MANILTNHETRLDSHEIQITGNKLLAETALSRTNANQSLTDYNSLMMNKNTDKITALETTVQSNTNDIIFLQNSKNSSTDNSSIVFSNIKKCVSQIAFILNGGSYIGSGWFFAENTEDLV